MVGFRSPWDVKCACVCVILCMAYFFVMDYNLYQAVQSLRAFPDNSSPPGEAYSPLKHITVKLLWMDPFNQYLEKPLAQAFVQGTRLNEILPFITPNVISCFHVFVAFGAARLIAKKGFQARHIAVSLMVLRNLLDTVDGALAREISKNHRMNDYSSFGYFFDGICDSTGVTLFFLGCVAWLKKMASKKGHLTPNGQLVFDNGLGSYQVLNGGKHDALPHVSVMHRQVWIVMWCCGIQLILSSVAWNLYMERFHNVLEVEALPDAAREIQLRIVKSGSFWMLSYAWRFMNAPIMQYYVLAAVFVDKLWAFATSIKYAGYLALGCLMLYTEYSLWMITEIMRSAVASG